MNVADRRPARGTSERRLPRGSGVEGMAVPVCRGREAEADPRKLLGQPRPDDLNGRRWSEHHLQLGDQSLSVEGELVDALNLLSVHLWWTFPCSTAPRSDRRASVPGAYRRPPSAAVPGFLALDPAENRTASAGAPPCLQRGASRTNVCHGWERRRRQARTHASRDSPAPRTGRQVPLRLMLCSISAVRSRSSLATNRQVAAAPARRRPTAGAGPRDW